MLLQWFYSKISIAKFFLLNGITSKHIKISWVQLPPGKATLTILKEIQKKNHKFKGMEFSLITYNLFLYIIWVNYELEGSMSMSYMVTSLFFLKAIQSMPYWIRTTLDQSQFPTLTLLLTGPQQVTYCLLFLTDKIRMMRYLSHVS
jgi:hypothetical protein